MGRGIVGSSFDGPTYIFREVIKMDDKQIEEFGKFVDQQMAERRKEIETEAMNELHDLFVGLTKTGFTEKQAMTLITSMLDTAVRRSMANDN